jgi:glycosyltransferase involved in cell wall biosynthesis
MPSVNADVTVIVPAYRAAATIGRALASVAAQTLPPRAAVVVDDGSPDDTFGKAEAMRPRMAAVDLKVIRQVNEGPGAARNRALAEATTEYVAFLDADDEWLPEKIERSMAKIESGGYVLVAHDSLEVRDGRETRLDCAARFRAHADAPFVGLYRRGFIDTSTVVARRNAVMAAGGFDTTLANGQDFALWLAMLARPDARFLVFDEVLSRYHITSGSIMSHVERRRRCCMTIARRYVPALRDHPGSPLASLWFRTLAVHREAAAAHARRGAWLHALRTVALGPFNLVAASVAYLQGRA